MLVCGAVLLDGGHEGFELHDDQLGAITGRDIVHPAGQQNIHGVGEALVLVQEGGVHVMDPTSYDRIKVDMGGGPEVLRLPDVVERAGAQDNPHPTGGFNRVCVNNLTHITPILVSILPGAYLLGGDVWMPHLEYVVTADSALLAILGFTYNSWRPAGSRR